jgi:type I restriction enzyme M protein
MDMINFKKTANFIWDIANLLRGDYKQSDYGKVILPFTVLRRLDCVLSPTKQKVLDYLPKLQSTNVQNVDPILNKVAKHNFHNRSKYDFEKLIADPDNIAANLRNYINGFSENAREIIEYFEFDKQIDRLEKSNLLYLVVKRFQEVDMHPDTMSNVEAGYLFEELIRKFAEISNETAGEHFTPREVIRLMVNLLFMADKNVLTQAGIVKTLYDPAGGTGGMLTVADEYVRELNPDSRLELFGQEINPESYAIFKADMLIKGQNASNVKFGNSFTDDGLEGHKFDYMLSNPPFGVSWKKVQKKIKKEYEDLGFSGRFGAGLPRVSDGSLLFLQHMMSKMKQGEQGTRLAIVFNGSPLFTGSAGSGESEIRRWIIENDMLEAIIALPDQLFYNTGISTYIWVVDNRKRPERKGKVQLINAVSMFKKMSKSLGNKRNLISKAQIAKITQIYGDFEEGKYCKIFDNEDFGYSRITVERPERDENGEIVTDRSGNPKADSSLRDYENVPLKEDVEEYFKREVLPHGPDAWIEHSKTKIGYEINFTRYFYEYTPLRPTSEIRADILKLKDQMTGLTLKAIN